MIAIGPAGVIPKDWCHRAVHYASKKDIVHYGENLYTLFLSAFNAETQRPEMLNGLIDNKPRLILLEPYEDAQGIDHDFQSPTFTKVIEGWIENYLTTEG